MTRAPATISIGTNPTFTIADAPVRSRAVRHHDLELYGDTVRLEFVDFQRPTLKFDSAEALVEQMHLDVEVTRRTLGAGTVGAPPTG